VGLEYRSPETGVAKVLLDVHGTHASGSRAQYITVRQWCGVSTCRRSMSVGPITHQAAEVELEAFSLPLVSSNDASEVGADGMLEVRPSSPNK
jgi:hypothetical protein